MLRLKVGYKEKINAGDAEGEDPKSYTVQYSNDKIFVLRFMFALT